MYIYNYNFNNPYQQCCDNKHNVNKINTISELGVITHVVSMTIATQHMIMGITSITDDTLSEIKMCRQVDVCTGIHKC